MTLVKQQNSKKRKNYDSWLLIFFLLLAFYSLKILLSNQNFNSIQKNGEVIASISNTIEEVRFRKNADFKWQNADKGQGLHSRDRIFTGDNSQAEITVNKSKIRIKENSLIEIGIQRDFDVKFEFGHIVLNMQKNPLTIVIKDKKYNIQPTAATTVAINIEKEKVEFIGDENLVKIQEENNLKTIEIVEKVHFNQSICGSKTYNSRLIAQSLCLDCVNLKIYQKTENNIIELNLIEDIFLTYGKNIFSLNVSNELCEIELLKPKSPEIVLESQNLILTYEKKLAEIKTRFLDSNKIKDKHFVLEVSRSNSFRLSSKFSQTDNDFILKLKDEGAYYLRLKTCLGDDCSEYSDVLSVLIKKPEKLPSPILNKQYKIKKKNLTFERSPDSNEHLFQFEEVIGAIKYRYEIKGERDFVSNGEVSSPELDLSILPIGKYHLRIASVDRWDRLGNWAETVIDIEADVENLSKPQDDSNKFDLLGDHIEESKNIIKNNNRYFYNYFIGPSFYQLKQTGSAGKANGASFSSSYLNSSFGYQRNDFRLWFKYQNNDVWAKSSANKIRFKTTELLIDSTYSNLKFGIGYRIFPFINVQEGSFTFRPKSSTFLEIGRSIQLLENWHKTEVNLDIKLRSDLLAGPMRKYDGLVTNIDSLTSILKNQIYWYNGIEIVFERLAIVDNSLQARQIVLRELFKTGLTFEF
jgi:hypothetical protein